MRTMSAKRYWRTDTKVLFWGTVLGYCFGVTKRGGNLKPGMDKPLRVDGSSGYNRPSSRARAIASVRL